MKEGQFDLRRWEWEHTMVKNVETIVLVFGLKWHLYINALMVNVDRVKISGNDVVTKRMMLSMAQRVTDPVGFTCALILIPKILLQAFLTKNLK